MGVEITELKEGTFYARLVLNISGKDISIDSRSSDGIALAVRLKCPIYIDEHVVDEAGVSVNIITGSAEAYSTNKEDELKNLKELLSQAVDEEDYEEAAKLRDRRTLREVANGATSTGSSPGLGRLRRRPATSMRGASQARGTAALAGRTRAGRVLSASITMAV